MEVLKKARGESDVGRLWTKQSGDKGSSRELASCGICSPEQPPTLQKQETAGAPQKISQYNHPNEGQNIPPHLQTATHDGRNQRVPQKMKKVKRVSQKMKILVLEESCPAADGMRGRAAPLFYTDPSQRLSTEHLTLRMGHVHGHRRSCTHPLLRDGQHVESSHSFSMEAGEEKAGPLYLFFPKMRCGGQSCQNGWPSPKWMAGEQSCPQIHSLGRADGGGTASTPSWRREQGGPSPGRHSGRCPGPLDGE